MPSLPSEAELWRVSIVISRSIRIAVVIVVIRVESCWYIVCFELPLLHDDWFVARR